MSGLACIIVNYRGAGDVIECLESLLRGDLVPRIVVVDNASGDGSLDRIAAWAAGAGDPPVPSPVLAALSVPPVAKPVTCIRAAADAPPKDVPLTLIDAERNAGFAAGNNVGLRHLLPDTALNQFWLLNPDTVVDAGAAAALADRMRADPTIGMCGTRVHFYHRPDRIQVLNGHRFDAFTGRSWGIEGDKPVSTGFDRAAVEATTDFVMGASLGVSRGYVETVGLMEERYFLYFEEIDWAWRNRGRFRIGFADGAVVYHKEGGSIGSSSRRGGRSRLSEYHLMRSKLLLIARFRPWLLPIHWAFAVVQIVARVARGQPDKAAVMTRALFGLKG